jgi:hypothetical protein
MISSPKTISIGTTHFPSEGETYRLMLRSSLSVVENAARYGSDEEMIDLYRRVKQISGILERERGCSKK